MKSDLRSGQDRQDDKLVGRLQNECVKNLHLGAIKLSLTSHDWRAFDQETPQWAHVTQAIIL